MTRRPARSCGALSWCRSLDSPAASPGREAISGRPEALRSGCLQPTIRKTNLAYWGTGNGGPWMGDQRPGDNLYTSSVVALDAKSGEIKGHFQYHQNDPWDWDEVSAPMLIDYSHQGRTVKGL